ncbi:hypothetical protein KI387_036488 [Taxus chinensis]|uniref:ubiquitinyl hydrolase 1 n=1 Tax=Taxus chinensis TaxID=29808 RepID=A0AA38FR55_TAXCH|nr:hypothetical protein KI387_036488 [Taxus chinensis]
MRRPRRKAAIETEKRATELLLANSVESGSLSFDHESDKEPTMEAVMCTRSNRKKENAVHDNKSSKATIEVILNQNDMVGSDTDDSDFELEMQPSEDEHDDLSNGEEIIVSSDREARNKRKRAKPLRTTNRGKRFQKQKERKSSHFGDGINDNLNWKVWEKDLEDWEPWRNGEIDIDALAQKKGPVEEQEPPPELLMPLLPFQKEWLAWSIKQEESEFKGGILADEMGMGKTIQAISLILTSRFLRSRVPLRENSPLPPNIVGESSSKTKVLPQINATLVVCPMVAVIQWRNEITRFTSEGSTKVLVYHGANRCKNVLELSEYDVVLTTYNIVESEYRKKMMPGKEKCQWCHRLFYPDRLAVHQRYFCGPTAVKSEKQSKQVKKKEKHIFNCKTYKKKTTDDDNDGGVVDVNKGNMKGKQKFKGSSKDEISIDGKPQSSRIKKKNVDLDKPAESANKGSGSSSILHSIIWDRIILDEAHFIKDRTCSTAKAVFSLGSSYKWALSGTPLQNRVGELYSLVRFLQIYPYSYYFCKKCNCKSLDYSFGKDGQKCDECGHSPPLHFCWWNKFVANPIKKWGYMHEGRKALILLKYKVLNSIVLRRTKIERAADLALPPKIACLRRDAFDAREEDFYQALYTQSQSQFNTYIDAGTLVNNYAHIFDLLTRLRQAVDHPYLVVYSKTSRSNLNDQSSSFDLSSGKDGCGLCRDELDDPVSATCGHTFCKGCIEEYISITGQPSCPSCSEPLTIDLTRRKTANSQDTANKVKGYKRSSILNRINLDNFQTSTKIDALREEIVLMLQKDAAAKAIVFSQFTSFLDLIRFCLQKSGIKCVQLDGSMSIQARDQTIQKFTNDPDYKVFLMSLKAGGVALNLTVASYVFLMDPWWNPAVEQQAQDRIHRLGQYKPIRVVRFVIANTIEERILRLQEKKQLVFEGAVTAMVVERQDVANGGLLYHEVQESKLCVVNSVNRVLEGPCFTELDLVSIAADLDQKEKHMMMEGGLDSVDYLQFMFEDSSNVAMDGDFSVWVFTVSSAFFVLFIRI